MLNFSAISLSNYSLLVFFILTIFKGAILLATSINFWKKIVIYLVYIMVFLIIWECNFAQSIFIIIFLKDLNKICLRSPTFSFLTFLL